MPQLFPMSWNFLTLTFLMIMITSLIFLYFSALPLLKFKSFSKTLLQKVWKW
uniref:ATP synthase F0 subunit 8 n=1 Tax=Ornithodoros furcosus TaxID=2928876 RepID=UPI002237308C|nr:ATP synthase F0 subunit 8 [Ornithodoros furcosus]UYB78317.1 ATP synthase F0 subunit 8 [Ornithodoros furcosus]UYB78330.1 ATP synthase F0 subunit 8 [Ornithodoros furcosus]